MPKYKVTTYYVTKTEQIIEAENTKQALSKSKWIAPDLFNIQVEDNMTYDRCDVEEIKEGD